jgi:hypothetical protein
MNNTRIPDDDVDERRALEDAQRMSAGIRALHRPSIVKQPRTPQSVPGPVPGAVPEPGPDGRPAPDGYRPAPTDRQIALTVRCPICKAGPRTGCQRVAGRPMAGIHPSRLDLVRPKATQDPPDHPPQPPDQP